MSSTATEALNESLVLVKTTKGLDEVKSRSHGLSQHLRALLIVVDGATTVRQLLARFGGIADVKAGLETLVDQGFVASAAPAPAPKPAAPAAAHESRDQALGGLTRMLHEVLGPDADLLGMRLENAKDPAAFADAVARAADVLAVVAGPQKAQRFRDAVQAYHERFLAGA
jgi:hypothetical protein